MTRQVKCGDTEWCAECGNNHLTEGDVACMTENALGRCDFYDGPNVQKRPRSQSASAHPNSGKD